MLGEKIGRLWCRLMHSSLMWPIHGVYQCRTCLRRFPLRWEDSLSTLVDDRPLQILLPMDRRAVHCAVDARR